MEKVLMEITPGVAVGTLRFGIAPEQAASTLGEPQNVGRTEDDEIEWQYPAVGLSLYFEGEEPQLSSVLIESPAVTLFGERVVGMSEGRFTVVARQHGGTVEKSDWSDDEGTFLIVPELGLFASVEDGTVVSIVCESAASAA
jgi:hypothetical protein